VALISTGPDHLEASIYEPLLPMNKYLRREDGLQLDAYDVRDTFLSLKLVRLPVPTIAFLFDV
jgi:hypothetical protein